MHFEYGFCDGYARAAVDKYQRRFPDRRIPSRGVVTRIHQNMRDTACLPGVAVHYESEVIRTINTLHNILQMVLSCPRLSTRIMASHIGLSRMQISLTLHEDDLYTYLDQRVQHIVPCSTYRFVPLDKSTFSDVTSFIRDDISNSRYLHVVP
jgi:hypothetical protein